jgi:methylated-DNA-[protein]-cysteine S-methyltransferase
MESISLPSPVGQLCVSVDDGAIVRVSWGETAPSETTNNVLNSSVEQLQAYFAGELEVFDLPLAPGGNTFQQRVCDAMLAIPFGQTATYGELAKQLETMPQPVGQACGGNTIPIIIPCHRVLAAGGIGGYSGAGGLDTKIALLKHEGAFPYLL